MRWWFQITSFWLLVAGLVRAEVAQNADYIFGWQQRPAAAQVSSYWIFRRVPPSPFYSVALVTGNTNLAVVPNVTTLIRYEWAIAPSNSLGLGDLSEIVPTPSNPGRVRDARMVAVRLKVKPPAVIEQGPTMQQWSDRFVMLPAKDGTVTFTYMLEPDEPFQFWRWRTLTNAAEFAPKPR